jgi:hypothetical protein
MRHCRVRLVAALGAISAAAGCGGGADDGASKVTKVQEGAVVYSDALKDNQGDWFVDEPHKIVFRDGRYEWLDLPPKKSPASGAGKLIAKHIPEGLAASVSVSVEDGAALRALTCREIGPRDELPKAWYELGVDGRQALIRRMSVGAPPKVLARVQKSVPNGKAVRLTGQCVPDKKGGLVLALDLDGKQVAQARDAKPLPAVHDGLEATPGIRAYARPDTTVPADLAWTDYEVRSASVP